MKCDTNPAKISKIIHMQEQRKRNRGLVDTDLSRLCGEVPDGVMHITSGCRMLASEST